MTEEVTDTPAVKPKKPRSKAVWRGVIVLLALGLVTTLVDLAALPDQELARAVAQKQRFEVNPLSGVVTFGGEEAKPDADGDAPPVPVETDAVSQGASAPDAAATAPESTPDVPSAADSVAPNPAPPIVDATPPSAVKLRREPLAVNPAPVLRDKDSLVAAPAPEVTEKVDGLALPKRGGKHATPASLYARPFARKEGQAMLAFVVLDVGMDPQSVALLQAMPAAVSVAYSPYAKTKAEYSENLRTRGHELWLMLPSMTAAYPQDDPGALGLVTNVTEKEALQRLHAVLASVPGSVGLVLPPEETISNNRSFFTPLLEEIHARGLLLLSTNPERKMDAMTADPLLVSIIQQADVLLDPQVDAAQIEEKLAGIQAAAKQKESYVVVLSSRPQSLQLLTEWLQQLPEDKTLALAPLSALYTPQAVKQVEHVETKAVAEKAKPKSKLQPIERQNNGKPK